MRKRYTVKEIFSLAITAEAKARSLYIEFARIFRHVPAASVFWKVMADDERLHENKLREMFKTLSEDETLTLKDDPLFEKAESFVSAISISKIISETLTLDDAYETAYTIEYSEVNAVMRFVLIDLVAPEARRAFTISNVEEHVARLETFSKTVCDVVCRRAIQVISVE